MKHLETWKKWIDCVSPVGSRFANLDAGERQALAEALAYAAPQGPRGFVCVDHCKCHETDRLAVNLAKELGDSSYVQDLQKAIEMDLLAGSARVQFPAELLARAAIAVSPRVEETVRARVAWPHTWSAIFVNSAPK